MLEFITNDYLLIPYGSSFKWDIKKINLVGVDSGKSYFECDVNCIFLDKKSSPPLSIYDINSISVNEVVGEYDFSFNQYDAYNSIKKYLKERCDMDYEKKFFRLIF